MKFKTTITIGLLVLIAVAGAWFYFNNNYSVSMASYQFKGMVIEVREDNLAVIGGYIEPDEDGTDRDYSKIVTVFFPDNVEIFKKSMSATIDGLSSDPNLKLENIKPESVSIARLKSDIEKYNPVLTVNAVEDIYGKDAFYAASIEYIIISSQ